MVQNDQGADHPESKTAQISAVKLRACPIPPVERKQALKLKLFGDNEEQLAKKSPAVKREQPDIISSFTQHSQPEVILGIAESSAGLSSAITVLSVRRK